MHAWGSTTPPGNDALALTCIAMLPSDSDNTVGSRIAYFEAQFRLPAYAPVNASSAASRSPSHDSDSRWLAIPFLTTLSFVTPCRFIPALSARLDVSIPSAFFGQRDITPAFGYGAPHSGARGTSTLLNNALLSAHFRASDGLVARPVAGYHYSANWVICTGRTFTC